VAVPALEVRNLSKHFGGARALDGVSLTVLPGEVHGLLGENGSGKSTLIKVLAGYHAPDTGELHVRGEEVKLPLPPGRFRELGLSFVHQDLGLIPSLSVVENLRIAEHDRIGRPWFVSWRDERRRARAVFDRHGVSLRPEAKVAALSPMERALLAIVRAVEGLPDRRGVLVLDEPTVFLPKTGTEQLFDLVRDIAAAGSSIVFVSHDLDEVHEITDRVTVLRDGRVVGTVVTRETTKARLVQMIVGRDLEELQAERHDLRRERVSTSVDGLRGGRLRDVSLELHRGEVLGVTGLAGSGFEDLPYLLYGARPAEAGTLRLEGRELDLTALTPAQALRAGVALLPGDRQRDGAVGSLSVTDNVTLQKLDDYYAAAALQRRRMVADARALCREFDVRPANPRVTYSSLSGGNQQKAMLAKWLQLKPDLLLLHEPTQGVDVGARQQIFGMVREAAAGGASVLCASSDYEQLALLCDRVLIFGLGIVVRELVGDAATKERITEQAYNSMVLAQELEAVG
jgi:ribose transport system ATP-binding protein